MKIFEDGDLICNGCDMYGCEINDKECTCECHNPKEIL